MKKRSGFLSMILPFSSAKIKKGVAVDQSYKYFSRGLSAKLTVLFLLPLTIISILSYFQYQKLRLQEEADHLILNLEEASGTINKFLSELQSIVKFVARDDRYQELLDAKELEALFARLKNEYPGFADIELIDVQGLQRSYVGPYQLEGRNYTDQTWYKEVLLHGVYISDVYSGYRNALHFVIAVSRKHPRHKGHWVLRVTIDAKTLQDVVDTVSFRYVDDIFLVNADGFPQTKPRKFGKIGEKCVLPTKEDITEESYLKRIEKSNLMSQKKSGMIIARKISKGLHITHSIINLENTPWRLVLVKEEHLYADVWRLFNLRLIIFFYVSCAIVAVFVISEISNALTNQIHESDKKRKQFLAEAEQSNKLASIGRLAAGVAHEINNPLAIINQKVGLVQDFIEMSEDFKFKGAMGEALDGVQNSVERCKAITHRLLGFARQTDVETEEIDINATLREVVEFLAKEATYNQIRIDFDLNEDVDKIFSDYGRLQQIFLNITNNAIDAIGSSGQIILSSNQIDEEHIQVKIDDNGPGMSTEIQKRIFDPFFTTKETGKGTGLGLSITYGLVKKLGGDIKVKSEEGRGTTFEITLPVTQN